MAKKLTSVEEIEASLVADGASHYAHFRKRHPTERVYAFLFELSAVGYAAAAAIATEEALARFADECADSYGDDINLAKQDLRWAGPENGWYQSPDKDFRNTNKLLDVAEKMELYGEYDGTLETAALSALKRMVDDGVFGTASELAGMTVGICHTGGDNSEEDFINWASSVNSPSVINRLKEELRGRA